MLELCTAYIAIVPRYHPMLSKSLGLRVWRSQCHCDVAIRQVQLFQVSFHWAVSLPRYLGGWPNGRFLLSRYHSVTRDSSWHVWLYLIKFFIYKCCVPPPAKLRKGHRASSVAFAEVEEGRRKVWNNCLRFSESVCVYIRGLYFPKQLKILFRVNIEINFIDVEINFKSIILTSKVVKKLFCVRSIICQRSHVAKA